MGRFSDVVLVLMASLLLASTTEKSHASSPAKSHAPSQSSALSKASPSPSPSSAPPKAAPTTPKAESPPSPPSSSPVSSAEISPSSSSGSCCEILKAGKLSPHYIRPYEILERVRPVAYRLALPSKLSRLHDVFHVSMLRKYISDPSHVMESQPIELKDDLSYGDLDFGLEDTSTTF
ncbi:unnamed protein product [Prunus brigantina]